MTSLTRITVPLIISVLWFVGAAVADSVGISLFFIGFGVYFLYVHLDKKQWPAGMYTKEDLDDLE